MKKHMTVVFLCTLIFCSLFAYVQANGGHEEDASSIAAANNGSAEPDAVFPESFGGHYYEEGKLNICLSVSENELSKSSLAEDKKLAKLISDKNVKTRQVKYSFNNLKYVQTALGESKISDFGVASTDLDVVSNSVILNLYSKEANNKGKLIDYLRALKVDLGMIQINISDTKPELLLPN